MQNEPNFKKVKFNATYAIAKDYEQKDTWSIRKNEPKTNPIRTQSKPIKAKTKPIQTQYKANFRKAKMNVNSLITKDYRKNDAFAVQKNKPKTNPIHWMLK